MSTIIETDILVCGLGPAGACAAAEAARAGADVLAIERNAVAGEPVQCAEFIPMMMGADAPQTRSARIQEIGRMLTHVAGEAPDLTPDFKGYMVDRAEFDRLLLADAIRAGAEIRHAFPVREFRPDGTAIAGSGQAIRARVVIGADGPRSAVGKAIGQVNTDLVDTRQITVDLLQPHDGTDIFLHPAIAGGYAWLFPKGGICNIGLGVEPSHKRHLKPLLEGLHSRLVAQGRVGARIHRHTGGLIPVGGIVGPAGSIGSVPAILAGDAAGLTNPVTGAGINAAVVSGRMAGRAAAARVAGDETAIDGYAEELGDLFGPSLGQALFRRRELLERYGKGDGPGPQDLRLGWIAYPQYWKRETAQQPLFSGALRAMEARETA